MQLDLTDEEASALRKLLADAIEDDRYPLSPRVQALRRILAKLEPIAPRRHRPECQRKTLGETISRSWIKLRRSRPSRPVAFVRPPEHARNALHNFPFRLLLGVLREGRRCDRLPRHT